MTKRTKSGLIVPSDMPEVATPALKEEWWTPADITHMGTASTFYMHRNLMVLPVCQGCQEVLTIKGTKDGAVALCSCTVRHWPEPEVIQ